MKKFFLSLFLIFFTASHSIAGDYYVVGADCFKKGLYDKATTSLEHAVKVSPKNVNARYYLAQSYLAQKRTDDAIKQYDRIIVINPSSDAARLAQKGLALIYQSYTEIGGNKTISNDGLAQYKDNYLNYVLTGDGLLMKWAKFPINVYIDPKRQKTLAEKAFKQWQDKTNNLVSFNFVNAPETAQISVNFMDKLESSSTKDSYVAGFSKPYYQGENIVKSNINILTINPATRQPIEDSFVYFTTLHEIGHSLGLKGHSPKSEDVMYGQASDPKANLTQRDINTMNLFYKTDKKTLASRSKGQTDVQLQQALAYVKATPDKAVGWANLGDIYRNKKMYSEAIQNYNKAISIEPNKAELYNLVGTTYSQMGDPSKGFSNLKKACDLDKNNIFYLYQFGQLCAKTNQKEVGKNYVEKYLQANPQSASDEKIQSLLQSYK